jgi:D-aspartate ligase
MRKSLPKNKPGAVIIEGHVQGLSNMRSLGEAGIPVYVVDKYNCIARYSKYCRKFLRCPDYLKDEFAEFLIEIAISENFTGWVLIPSNDHAVYTISKHKSHLEQYYKIITPDLKIIEKIYDKSKLLTIAGQNNIPIPTTYYFTSADDVIGKDITYPVITKGKMGLSFYQAVGKKALLANNENEFRDQLKTIGGRYDKEGTFTQELVPLNGKNHTVSFTAFCENGEIKTYWMGEKLREHPLYFGTATFTKSVHYEDCYRQSVPLLKALQYTGVCEVEYILDPRDNIYKLIEINARTWLWVGLAKACGIDYARIIYDYVNNNGVHYPDTYQVDRYWINPVSDTAYAMVGLLRGKYTYSGYLSSLFNRKMTNALFKNGDHKPGIMYLFKLYSFLKER